MRKLVIGILITGFFSIAGTCSDDGNTAPNVSITGDQGFVNAVPEPSSLLLATTGALVIGLAIRRSRR